MNIFMCGPDGKPAKPTAKDRNIVQQFQRSLIRGFGRPQLDQFFDGDAHADTPAIIDRRDYGVRRDGTVGVWMQGRVL